jgi:hypothetical protein
MEQKRLSKAGLAKEMGKICVGVKNKDTRLLSESSR